jgi:translation initiation factor IF-3
VRVIDGTNNSQLGVMSSMDALRRARAMGLDLVEVAATADPPVCRICDYGKWKYEQAKQAKSKVKTTKVKEVKFRVGIDVHDYNIKMAHAESFLEEGHKLRLVVMFKGRQMAHPEIGFELINRAIEDLKTMGHSDVVPRQAGRNIGTMLSPLAKHLRKPKFTVHFGKKALIEDDEEDDSEEEDEGNASAPAPGPQSS